MSTDYFAAEPLIIARLKAAVPALRTVLGVAELADVPAASQPTPAAFVIYDGDELGATSSSGAAQIVKQRWLVVIAVSQGKGDGYDSRRVAGPLVSDTLAALQGWAPAGYREMHRVGGPGPAYVNGVAYLPLAFTAQMKH